MVIARPVTKTMVATVGWGIPITDEVNRLTGLANDGSQTYSVVKFVGDVAVPSGAPYQFVLTNIMTRGMTFASNGITVTRAGVYRISGFVCLRAGTGGSYSQIVVLVNGASIGQDTVAGIASGSYNAIPVGATVSLSVGNVINFHVVTDRTGVLTDNRNNIHVQWIGL